MDNNKLISIHILEILNEHSNPNHKITQEDIMFYLERDYGERIVRRTCSDYLKELRNAGYISGTRGVFRVDLFTERELRTLIDGVMYGKHIPEKDANVLIKKLKSLSLNTMKDKAKSITYLSGINRTENNNLYYILDKIDEAIEAGKKIEITQFTPTADGNRIEWNPKVVDPYFVVSDQSRYYLLCHGTREGLEPRRIDTISKITIIDDKKEPLSNIVGYDFDLGKYMREHIYMFSGEVSRVAIKIKTRNIGAFNDWFGTNYFIRENNEDYSILSVTTNLNAVYYWAMQYGEIAEVLEPESLRNRIKNGLTEILDKYK